jgi:ketosteroid isomerase-like protein
MPRWWTLLLLLACSCGGSQPRPADASSSHSIAVARVLDEFHAAAAAADEARYFAQLSDDAVFLGTDASERWTKPAFRSWARPHFARKKAWSFRAVRREIVIDAGGDTAWFDEDLATERLGPARGSGVLVRRAGRWQIAQYNLALTIPNARFSLVHEAADPTVTPRAAKASEPLAALGWLAGAWIAQRPDGETLEELWMIPDGATLLGSGRSVKAGKTSFFEYLRIEARAGQVLYIAQPLGRPATEFVRVSDQPDEVVFENRAHDWPKRLSYRRTQGGIQVRVEGDPGQKVDQFTLTRALIERR